MEIDKNFNLMVGLRIREIRETLGMSREKFCSICDISESFLTTVERGEKSITTKTLYKICTGANVSADYIVFGKNQGYEMDTILELFNGLDTEYQEHAVRILSEYCRAIKKAGNKNLNPQT